jgi:hypothetical protein
MIILCWLGERATTDIEDEFLMRESAPYLGLLVVQLLLDL